MIVATAASSFAMASASHDDGGRKRVIKVDKKYLSLPVSEDGEMSRMTIETSGLEPTYFNIRLACDSPDYWMAYDMTPYVGKTVEVTYAGAVPMDAIVMADTVIGKCAVYEETYRPQYHFSTARGWINDPNGLVYHDGEFHLFYQYNPAGVEWGNLNWGHAVSRDLIHWQELPIALRIGPEGEMYSGSAIVDYDNVSGLGQNGMAPMLAYYTVQTVKSEIYRDGQTQCLAYSNDNGRTWHKYEGNPIVDTCMKGDTWHNRDPKVFRHEASGKWVMVLHEKDGHSIYNSDNLTDWTYESHVPGFWECPELFELPVDGDLNNRKWVLSGASGNYMTGEFDGKVFVPDGGKHMYVGGRFYAPQTFNGEPSGRRVQIAWSNIRKSGMPFTGQMLLPTELKLVYTSEGIRLKCVPVCEVKSLLQPILSVKNMTVDEVNRLIAEKVDDTDCLCVKARFTMSHPTNAGLMLDGVKVLDYDLNFNRINGMPYFPQETGGLSLEFEMYIDRMSVETFYDGGLYVDISERMYSNDNCGLAFWSLEPMTVESLDVYKVDGIWNVDQ